MKDISKELSNIIEDNDCPSLLAFMCVQEDEVHIQKRESIKEDNTSN